MYNNNSYITLVSETLDELKTYAGAEQPRLPHSKGFLALLAKHGFCVTPRMYSKCEILCIAIAMLDSEHHYVRIQQKTDTPKHEVLSNPKPLNLNPKPKPQYRKVFEVWPCLTLV